VINVFICGITYEALIHTLGRKTSRTMREFLDITTQYAIGKEAV
jgi:hypothetical protein